jgi:lipid-A-disaccharide synthase
MLVLFPFETAFYASEGVPATFVGHPAAARRDPPARADILTGVGLDPLRPVVALLPGSRRGEVSRVLPPLLEAARQLAATHPRLQFVVPRAATLPEGFLEEIVGRRPVPFVSIVRGSYPSILEACDAGAVASGTATLDAALAGLPFVAVYRMQGLSYAIARALVRVDHIALPNLVAGERLVPELVQREFTPAAVASVVARYLDDPAHAERIRAALGGLRSKLAGDGAFRRAAEAILAESAGDMLQSAPS